MEKFCLSIQANTKKGQVWEIQMHPNLSDRMTTKAAAIVLGSANSSDSIDTLKSIVELINSKARSKENVIPIILKPDSENWVPNAVGMKLALAIVSARYLLKTPQRTMFKSGLLELPDEVVLYWFTMCFYGYRQQAARAAFRTLLTFEQTDERFAELDEGSPSKGLVDRKPTIEGPKRKLPNEQVQQVLFKHENNAPLFNDSIED